MATAAHTGSFDALVAEEPFSGIRRQGFSTGKATVARYMFEPGARFPLHHHGQEQVTVVEAGSIEMTINEETSELGPGGWSVVPGEVEHGITAGSQGARVLALIIPRREGSDDYELSGASA